jgi:hypothetical protein
MFIGINSNGHSTTASQITRLADAERILKIARINHNTANIRLNCQDKLINMTKSSSVIAIAPLVLKNYSLDLIQIPLSEMLALN